MASLQQLAEDSNISPLAPPELDPEQLELPESGPFVYEFDVEVRPEFDLPDYKGMKIRKPVHKFTDADIAGGACAGSWSRKARWSPRKARTSRSSRTTSSSATWSPWTAARS